MKIWVSHLKFLNIFSSSMSDNFATPSTPVAFRRFFATVFVSSFPESIETLVLSLFEGCRYRAAGYHIGSESGRMHIHFAVILANTRRRNAICNTLLRALDGCEPHHPNVLSLRANTEEQVMNYLNKNSRSFSDGTFTTQGERSDLKKVCGELQEHGDLKRIAESYPDVYVRNYRGLGNLLSLTVNKQRRLDLKVYFVTGATGLGKTSGVLDRHGDENVFRPVVAKPKVWFDGYFAHPVVLFDDLNPDDISSNYLLQLLDIYYMTVEVKGGTVPYVPKFVYITSNMRFEAFLDSFPVHHRAALRRRFSLVYVYFEDCVHVDVVD
jgi:hypothetical protein